MYQCLPLAGMATWKSIKLQDYSEIAELEQLEVELQRL